MDSHLQEMLDLFVGNCQRAKADFFWKNTLSKRLAALLFAAENRQLDSEAIKLAESQIKSNTGFFSTFRGNSLMTVATLLALSSDAEQNLTATLKVYDLMKQERFHASDFLVVAACLIAIQSDESQYVQNVQRAKAFYESMKSAHWFLTGQDDHIYAAMVGLSSIDLQDAINRMEALYLDLKNEFFYKNSIQALAIILMLGSTDRDATHRLLTLKQYFRDYQLKMDQQYTLTSLGVLALLPQDASTVVTGVQGLYESLRNLPGFGFMSITKQERLLFAVAIYAFTAASQISKGLLAGTLSTSIASIIIAQQTAAVIASTSAASAAASASN